MEAIRTYLDETAETIRLLPTEHIQALLNVLLDAYHQERTIFTFGNGGSAATASHFACDLSKGTINPNRGRRFRVIALTDNVALITAWTNDTHYETVFAEQLHNLGRPGDVALAISGSGNSPNVLRAVAMARSQGMVTLGLAGFDGGRLATAVDRCVVVANNIMMQVEDAHMAICHLMTCWLRDALAGFPPDADRLPQLQ